MPATGQQPSAAGTQPTHAGCGMGSFSTANPKLELEPMMNPDHGSRAVANKDCSDTTNNTSQAQLVATPQTAHIMGATSGASEPSEGSQVTTIVTARYLPIKQLAPVPFGWVPRKSRTTKGRPSTVTWGSQDHTAAIASARRAMQAAARNPPLKRHNAESEDAAPKPKRQQRRRDTPPLLVPPTPQHQVGLGRTAHGSQGAAALLAAAGAEEDTLMGEEEVMVAATLAALGVGAAEADTEKEHDNQHNQHQHNHQQHQQSAQQQQAATQQQPHATGLTPELVAAARSWLVGQGMLREEGGQLDQLSAGLWRQWQKVLRYHHAGSVNEAMWLASQLGGATAALLPRS